jgi:hypothetical protein
VVSVDLGVTVTVSQGSGEGERSSVLMSSTSMGRDCWGSITITSMSTISSRSSGISIRTRGSSVSMTISSRCGVNGVSTLDHMGIESVVSISCVVDSTCSAISLHKTVVSLYNVTITCLALALLVSGVRVSNAVLIGVFRMCLYIILNINYDVV